MIAKVHNNNGQLILALCDKELLGKVYEEGENIIDLTAPFYQGKEATKEIITRLIQQSYMVNAVGKKVIAIIKKMNALEEEKVIKIAGIPYIQLVNTNMEN